MSLPASSRALRPALARLFTSSSAATAPADPPSTSKRPQARRQALGQYNIRYLEDFNFDDATSLGYLRLEKIRESQELVRKVALDREVLAAQRKPFNPPTGPLRITSTIDLSDPTSPHHVKRVLVAPVTALPLEGSSAVHRLKLLAGPRWTPGRPGQSEAEPEQGEGKDGWVKIAEERFPDARMNRKSVSDMLQRLVQAANDEASPLPATVPLDPRHLLARQRKKRQRAVLRRAEALNGRNEVIGGVKGFPAEWLSRPQE
ncbi:hypothetical protein JCM24511_05734 [Saitozyma sp. JCM 24511]|nr:hypothetical protein JCM24511_05734 [Saitozyma sp. JCM 24511]